MQFHPDKCLVMNILKKRHPSKFTYNSLHNTDLKTTDTAKYLGIIISQDMKWTKHITQTCSRANRALGFIKRNVKIRSPRIKEKLYNSLVRPHVEYASSVWSPHEVNPIHKLEMVQRRAARWTLLNKTATTTPAALKGCWKISNGGHWNSAAPSADWSFYSKLYMA